MNLKFDYYHNLEAVDLYLCNPDGRELFTVIGTNRRLKLRLNDLSELSFDVEATVTGQGGETLPLEAYDYLQTRRLIYATGIGWFVISNVVENDVGISKTKSVTCESLQATLKDRGFISEEKVYRFYNESDPKDNIYQSGVVSDAIPSVVGQLYQQLGILTDLKQGKNTPDVPYADWTITYINPDIKNMSRTFKDNTGYAYDWIVNDVEDAFEAIVQFDFLYKTIRVLSPSEVTVQGNIIFSFSNFMKDVKIEEKSENIVTVMNCSGDNCEIGAVNPTGKNYICDFSYYMDKENHRWMSDELIEKLEAWQAAVTAAKSGYEKKVQNLRSLYRENTEIAEHLTYLSTRLTDLKNARDEILKGEMKGGATIIAEKIQVGEKSVLAADSALPFSENTYINGHVKQPSYDGVNGIWKFTDSGAHDYASANYGANPQRLYFMDVSDGKSYCKLFDAATVDAETKEKTFYCKGFYRYISYPEVGNWVERYEATVQRLEQKRAEKQAEIESVKSEMNLISSNLNILSYLSDSPTLLRELTCYWVEGDYTNDNIAILDDTTDEQAVALMNELMETGKIELAKVCQPRLSFSLSAVDFTKQYEFHKQAAELELGRIVAVEKDDGIWFYPALLEIDMDLDSAESFELTFANALTLDDWGYSYADLISDVASTSRQVSANWQNMMGYSKAKDDLTSLVKAPLSAALRSSFANATNQEFTVDSTGILGRKLKSGASNAAKVFEDEQLRILNNLLLFTDDGWKTAKTALGKVTYTDESGNEHTSYGLVAETILGSLIMSNALQIRNESNTVNLGVDGMTIRQPDGTVVFRATSDGDLSVTGEINATSGTIGGWAIGEECIHTVSGVYGNWIGADTANNSTVRTTGYLFTFLMFRSGLLYRVYEDNSVDSTLYVEYKNYREDTEASSDL